MDLADDEFADASVATDAYRPKTLASVIESEKALRRMKADVKPEHYAAFVANCSVWRLRA